LSRVVTPLPEMRAVAPDLIGALEPVYIAETEAEREAVFSVRYSVYGAELGRKLGHADHGRERVTTKKTISRTRRCSTPTTAPAG
jgi:hypothetical protein